jgi:beta-lactamase class C
MRYLSYLLVIGLVCFLAPSDCNHATVHAQAPPRFSSEKVADPKISALVEDYDRFFESEMHQTGTPGASVVIVKDGQVVFKKGYGVRYLGSPDYVDENTVFRVGSLSKGFAAVLTGILVQNGVLNWQQHVKDWYPAFTLSDPEQANRVELRHVLSHTIGLPYQAFSNLIERNYDLNKIVTNYFPAARLYGPEGTYYSYQNAAYCLIGEVIHAATGKPYTDLLNEKIFEPAGMSSASCDYASMLATNDKAWPHLQRRRHHHNLGWQACPITTHYYNFAPAGGVNASATDMGEWLKVLMGNRPDIVSDSTLDYIFTPVIKTDKERRIFSHWINPEDASYAIGWRVLQKGDRTIVYHGGYVNGYKSEIAFDRKAGIGICVLTNAHTALCSESVPAFFDRLVE